MPPKVAFNAALIGLLDLLGILHYDKLLAHDEPVCISFAFQLSCYSPSMMLHSAHKAAHLMNKHGKHVILIMLLLLLLITNAHCSPNDVKYCRDEKFIINGDCQVARLVESGGHGPYSIAQIDAPQQEQELR